MYFYPRLPHLVTLLTVFALTLLILVSSQAMPVASRQTGTVIIDPITITTTWILTNSPYLVFGDVHVQAPLTIEPGVVVKMNPGSRLNVFHHLTVNGTADQPVFITSIRDDAIAGDTNGDGAASMPQAGDWQCICINGTGKFDYATIRYAGEEIANGTPGWDHGPNPYKRSANSYYPMLYAAHGTVLTLDHVTLQHASIGIHAMGWISYIPQITISHSNLEGMSRAAIMAGMWTGGNPYDHLITVTDSVFRNNQHGFLLEKSTLTIKGSTISDNEYGFEFRETAGLLERNMIYNNGTGIVAQSIVQLDHNSIFGNRNYGINAEMLLTDLDASNNWWGHASGPHHTSNPGGQGDRVSDRVLFSPMLLFPENKDLSTIELPIGKPVVLQLAPLMHYFVRVSPEIDRKLLLNLHTHDASTEEQRIQMFANAYTRPEEDHYDYVVETASNSSYVEIPLSPTMVDEYYLLLRAPYLLTGTISVTLQADYVDLRLTLVTPGQAAPEGDLTVEIQGTGFDSNMSATLISPTGVRLAAKNIGMQSTTSLLATFDLRNQSTGNYSLEVTRQRDGVISLFPDAVEIVPGEAGRLKLWIEGPEVVRSGKIYTYYLHYQNVGKSNLPTPFIAVTADAPDTAILSEGYQGTGSFVWLALGNTSRGTVLAPNGSGEIEFRVKATQDTRLYASVVEETTAPFDWMQFQEALSPLAITDEDFNALRSLLGETQGRVLNSLRGFQTVAGGDRSLSSLLIGGLNFVQTTVAAARTADEPDDEFCPASRPEQDEINKPSFMLRKVQLIILDEYKNDVRLFDENGIVILANKDKFDRQKPTIIITHGWLDCRKNKALSAIAKRLVTWTANTYNVVKINWGPLAKSPEGCEPRDPPWGILGEYDPRCARAVSRKLEAVADEANRKLQELDYDNNYWENTIYIGHSFGNAVNAYLADNHRLNVDSNHDPIAQGIALMINPAAMSGFGPDQMPNYSQAFGNTIAIYTDSFADLKDYSSSKTSDLITMKYVDPFCEGDCDKSLANGWIPNPNGQIPTSWMHGTGPFLLACLLKDSTNDNELVSAASCNPNAIGHSITATSLVFHNYRTLNIDPADCQNYTINASGDITRGTDDCEPLEDALTGIYPLRHLSSLDITVVGSIDPNDKIGPKGIGAEHIVGSDSVLNYTINFENLAAATAPVQELRIVDTLDPNLDWSTVQFGSVGFGSQVLELNTDPGVFDYFERNRLFSDVTAGTVAGEFRLDVSARFNIQIGRMEWYLKVIDTATGDLPADPLAGFLPPEDGSGRGQGYVTFSVKPKADVPMGTTIRNKAAIVFDANAPIETNEVSNLIDEVVDLSLEVAYSNPITSGQPITLTFTIINDGPNVANQTSFALSEVENAALQTLSATVGSCNTLSCEVGDLDIGEQRQIIARLVPHGTNRVMASAVISSTTKEPNGVNNQRLIQIDVTSLPISGLAAQNSGPTALGVSTSLTATVAQGDDITFTWNFGDGSSGSGAIVSHTYAVVGSYTAIVTATNVSSSQVATTVVKVQDLPIIQLQAQNSSPTLLGSTTAFTATTSGGSNAIYQWNFGDGNLSNGATASHTYMFPGSYSAMVTATNSVGSVSRSMEVTITDIPMPTGTPTGTVSATPISNFTTTPEAPTATPTPIVTNTPVPPAVTSTPPSVEKPQNWLYLPLVQR